MEIVAAHFNHRLRGAESDRDAAYAEATCCRLGVEYDAGAGDVSGYARDTGTSLEAAARELRYEFLSQAADRAGAQAVATGHTLDDQAETILLNIVRGAGLRGVAGMRHAVDLPISGDGRRLRVVRPMLALRRSEAVRYCQERGLEPLIDRSNADTKFPRNRLRVEAIPALESINPAVAEAIYRLGQSAQGDFEVIDELARGAAEAAISASDGGVAISKTRIRGLHKAVARRVMMCAYESVAGTLEGLSGVHLEDMLEVGCGRAGASLDLPGGLVMVSDRESVRLALAEDLDSDCPYPPWVAEQSLKTPGETHLAGGFRLVAQEQGVESLEAGRGYTAMLAPWLVEQPLVVRSRRAGDRFHPLGASGPVKLQDFLVNAGVPRRWRDRVPLVESPAGIAWVAGQRPAEWARVDPSLGRALRIELFGPG